MKIPFWKMHGAGNDFILINALASAYAFSPATIAAWCRRRTGVGAEGLILLLPPQTGGNFRMQFFNPDGHEAGMCGNGARCAARLAGDLGLAPPTAMIIETPGGPVQARLGRHNAVRLELPAPRRVRLQAALTLPDGTTLEYDFADTGVPHAIIACDNPEAVPIDRLGPAIRYHPDFAPEGTNASFIAIDAGGILHIRTYERGVEAETLACGTGIAAAAVTAVLAGRAASPVKIMAAGGDILEVEVGLQQDAVQTLSLTGPACYTFSGLLPAPAREDAPS